MMVMYKKIDNIYQGKGFLLRCCIIAFVVIFFTYCYRGHSSQYVIVWWVSMKMQNVITLPICVCVCLGTQEMASLSATVSVTVPRMRD